MKLSADVLEPGGSIQVEAELTNDGPVAGTDVVQLYLHDCTGSVTRPIKELKGFRRVSTEPGQTKKVAFRIDEDMLAFWRRDMTFGPEPGTFEVFVGFSSQDVLSATFTFGK